MYDSLSYGSLRPEVMHRVIHQMNTKPWYCRPSYGS